MYEPMRIKAVLFDLFDTLLLLEKDVSVYYEPSLRRLHESLVKSGIAFSFEDFKSVYLEVRKELLSEVEKSLEEPHFNVRVSRILQRFGYDFDVSNPIVVTSTNAFADEWMRYVRLDDEALDVLRTLHRSYKLGIITNFPIPKCVWRLLDKFGLRDFFDVVLVSAEVNKRKPSPEIFEIALRNLEVNASEAIFVGDQIDRDVQGARKAGIKSILIERRPDEKTTDVEPDRVIKNLKELQSMLDKSCVRRL